MSKTIDFRVRGDDPNLTQLKTMIAGIGHHTCDKTLVITEMKMISVTTENEVVAEILTRLQRANPSNGAIKKHGNRYTKKDDGNGNDSTKNIGNVPTNPASY